MCGEGQFCYDGLCNVCDQCQHCWDGVDNTCGTCGAGYPTLEPHVTCVKDSEVAVGLIAPGFQAKTLDCYNHQMCGEGNFCYDGLCDVCDQCQHCWDGVDNTCGTCGAGYPTLEPHVTCVKESEVAVDVDCDNHQMCGAGNFCYDGLCDVCDQCQHCWDGIDNTCGI